MNEMKMQLDHLHDKGVELSGRSDVYERTIAPHLTSINASWQRIQKDIDVCAVRVGYE
jgi:hypothetical protein